TMADMNILANDAPAEQAPGITPPTRTDDQILSSSNWVPIGNSNYVLDVQKSQRNPIFPIVLDEQWFNHHKDILRDALDITPTNNNNPFVDPPSNDTVIKYVNTLGYPSTLKNVSAMLVNALYQQWRAILSMINMCLTGKTAGYDRPRHPVLQILKNLVTTSRGKKKTTHPKRAPYYCEHQEHVAKYQQYLDVVHDKAEEGEATVSPKATKVTKPTAAKVTKPASDPKPKPAPTQPSKAVPEKKRKLVQETPDEPSPAKRSKGGLTPNNKSPVDQFIFQWRTPMATEASGPAESPSLDAKLALTDSEIESDDGVTKINTKDQDKGQAGPNLGIQDEGQAIPNPDIQNKGQAGSNPGDAAESQPQSSHVVHAGPNLEPMDIEATDASPFQNPEQLDEEVTTTAYLNVQENLKLLSEDSMIPEEPASSTKTLSYLQNLEKELSFTDQFFMEKQQEEEPGKTNAEAEVQSMVSILIHQDTSSVPPMTTPVIDLTTSQFGSPFPTSSATTSTVMATTIPPPPPQPQQSTTDPTLMKHIDELEQHMANLLQYNLALEERKRRDVPRTLFASPPPQPPPPHPPTGASGAPGSKALSLSKSAVLVPQSMAWTTSDTRYKSVGLSGTQELSPMDSLILDDSIPDEQVHLFDDKDSRNDHLPTADSRKGRWKPLPAEERPANPEPTWTIPSSTISDVENNWATALVSAYETPAENSLLTKTGDMTNFLNCKGGSLTLSISKMKAASYPDFGLELLMPEQILKAYSRYGYDYLCKIVLRRANFQEHTITEKDFINLHPSDFEDLNLLLLQSRLDHLLDSDKRMLSTAVKLWTQNLVIRQRVEDFQLGIESYQTQLNLTKPGWDATCYEFKHDYTIIESP
nr:hypothetical protein [Tanacetum cinerariifolium]